MQKRESIARFVLLQRANVTAHRYCIESGVPQ